MKKIAILGLGTVGGGVARLAEENAARIAAKLGEPLTVKTVLVRHFKNGPYRERMTDDFAAIERDPEIAAVVETIGGVDAACGYTERALAAGKHVITANKQLVAERGHELLALARTHGVRYLFEASVGGGIPVLHPLRECLAANRVDEIYGILNGTSNYILTNMAAGAAFADVLRDAQAKGYAEADPTADVEGIDAGRKICILADLAFGRRVRPQDVPMEGIGGLDLRDVRLAERAGCRVKLLGRCLRLADGRHTAYVAPHLIPADRPIAHVDGVLNAVAIRGDAVGGILLCGPGAGAMPTASACMSDVLEALSGPAPAGESGWGGDWAGFADPAALPFRHYLRVRGSLSDAAAALGKVESVGEDGGETAVLTGRMTGRAVRELAAGLDVRACLRVLD